MHILYIRLDTEKSKIQHEENKTTLPYQRNCESLSLAWSLSDKSLNSIPSWIICSYHQQPP